MEMKLLPVISEQSYTQAARGTYIFKVPTTASKQQIAAAVAGQFGVKVTTVTTSTTKGKVVRAYRKNGKTTVGTRSTVKKAYVRLAEGQKIALFAEGEEKK